jgi:hypothetical protein
MAPGDDPALRVLKAISAGVMRYTDLANRKFAFGAGALFEVEPSDSNAAVGQPTSVGASGFGVGSSIEIG